MRRYIVKKKSIQYDNIKKLDAKGILIPFLINERRLFNVDTQRIFYPLFGVYETTKKTKNMAKCIEMMVSKILSEKKNAFS